MNTTQQEVLKSIRLSVAIYEDNFGNKVILSPKGVATYSGALTKLTEEVWVTFPLVKV